MNIENKNLLTPNEVTFILIGIMLDVSVARLPNRVTAIAKQDGWISVIIGAAYPLYVAFLAIYVSGKFPKENILMLSKRYLGKLLGTTFNFLFLLSFLSLFPAALSMIGVIIRTYAVSVLTPLKIYVILFLLGVYVAHQGIKVLGRICSISFVFVLIIILPTIAILKEGSYLNISPVFGSGILNIIKASEASAYDYALLELIFLIYPFINDSSKIKKSVLKTVAISCILYIWIVFISIYYMGTAIISKSMWGFITASEGIKTEVISNLRYIFIFMWTIIAMKSIAIFCYTCVFILDNIKKIKSRKIVYVLMTVIVISITMKYYGDLPEISNLSKYTTRISVVYNLFYITLITILIWVKKEGLNEKI